MAGRISASPFVFEASGNFGQALHVCRSRFFEINNKRVLMRLCARIGYTPHETLQL